MTADQNAEIVANSIDAHFNSSLNCDKPDFTFYFVDKTVHEQFLYKNDIFSTVYYYTVILCDNCGDKDKKLKVDQVVSKVANKECKTLDSK